MGETEKMRMNSDESHRNAGSKDEMLPGFKMSSYRLRRSTLHRCLIVLLMLFFITTIIFLGLFVYYYIRHDEAGEGTANMCNTLDCVRAAGLMANKMNESADPCQDFHEYACGLYNKETRLPEGSVQTGSLYAIIDDNQIVMEEILTEEITPDQPEYLQNMKRLYKSCINEAQIEIIGLQPYLNETDFVRDWPTLNPAWDESSFNLNDVIARYAAVDTFTFMAPAVLPDFLNSSKRSLFFAQGEFSLPENYFLQPLNDSILVAYRTYLTEFAVTLGADRTTAEQDSSELIRFLGALSKILPTAADLQNLQTAYNPVTLKQLSALYPFIDIPRVLRATFATANMTLADDDIVINIAPAYFGNLSSVLNNFPNRAVQNFFGFKYANSRVEKLTKRIRKIQLEFYGVYLGQMKESPRPYECVSKVSTTFSNGMAKQFVLRRLSEKAKAYADSMVDHLASAFRQFLQETIWMGQETKDEALKKLGAMRRKVGYPDVNFTDDDINQKYKNYVMLKDNYYANLVLIDRQSGIDNKLTLRQPVDKSEWVSAPQELNARYSLSGNEILLHAAILQSPVFSLSFQDSMNYGAIGTVIGHEITHGFDSSGSQFDLNGNLRNWWQPSDMQVFRERIQCLVDQYSNFHLSEINMNVDGIFTLNENVADNGGLKESYRAYKELVKQKGESPTLPGLGLTQDQQFFLAFGQMWCEKITLEGLISTVRTNAHAPGKYRIIGVLQNSEEFSRAYNCPRGSYMNPEKKCSVW